MLAGVNETQQVNIKQFIFTGDGTFILENDLTFYIIPKYASGRVAEWQTLGT
jgi:hypothetical protein